MFFCSNYGLHHERKACPAYKDTCGLCKTMDIGRNIVKYLPDKIVNTSNNMKTSNNKYHSKYNK